jgi:anti-sigma regulatory factor (Ser/Thr protein kinase)
MRAINQLLTMERLPELIAFLTAELPEGFLALSPNLELALEELMVNINHYAYDGANGSVELVRRLVDFDGLNHLVLTIRDWGRAFDPFLEAAKPDLSLSFEDRPIGGLGLHLVKNMVSHYCYWRDLGANNVELFFKSQI